MIKKYVTPYIGTAVVVVVVLGIFAYLSKKSASVKTYLGVSAQ